jgi:hypothetical protein
MRYLARIGILAAALVCSTTLSGCREHWEYHFGPLALVETEVRSPEIVRPKRSPRHAQKRVVERVAEPKVVHAGAKIRSFCGQRHVRFQSGGLKETESEKARNDALCRQVY